MSSLLVLVLVVLASRRRHRLCEFFPRARAKRDEMNSRPIFFIKEKRKREGAFALLIRTPQRREKRARSRDARRTRRRRRRRRHDDGYHPEVLLFKQRGATHLARDEGIHRLGSAHGHGPERVCHVGRTFGRRHIRMALRVIRRRRYARCGFLHPHSFFLPPFVSFLGMTF